jgi:hypothetical protein
MFSTGPHWHLLAVPKLMYGVEVFIPKIGIRLSMAN